MPLGFFERLKQYVGFTDASSAALRELHPVAQPRFVPIVDDFYAAIDARPEARAAITGGRAQIERLEQTLVRWMDLLLLGPHDRSYYELRARIGRVHVRISLPQGFMFTKGSGLGLALCRRILEAHGGTIELEQTAKGASFLLALPAATPSHAVA